jgi:predicted ArsR family transcriptional regulator
MRIDGSPAGQILKLLQQQGPLSIKEIEAALGVTTTAVRQQLVTLMTTGMVMAKTVREKRGRPHAVYRLAAKGQELFAHGYEDLALALLEEVLYLPDTATCIKCCTCVSAPRATVSGACGVRVAERLQN